jgi:hypothetical protein
MTAINSSGDNEEREVFTARSHHHLQGNKIAVEIILALTQDLTKWIKRKKERMKQTEGRVNSDGKKMFGYAPLRRKKIKTEPSRQRED